MSPTLLSKMFRSLDNDNETISSPCVQVLPTCWWFTPEPRVHVVTALRASTSPAQRINHCHFLCMHTNLQSLTVQSTEDVAKLLLSGLQPQAICFSYNYAELTFICKDLRWYLYVHYQQLLLRHLQFSRHRGISSRPNQR